MGERRREKEHGGWEMERWKMEDNAGLVSRAVGDEAQIRSLKVERYLCAMNSVTTNSKQQQTTVYIHPSIIHFNSAHAHIKPQLHDPPRLRLRVVFAPVRQTVVLLRRRRRTRSRRRRVEQGAGIHEQTSFVVQRRRR